MKKAYTIIELLTVMSIIVVLMGIMVPALSAIRKYAKNVAQKNQFNDISKGLEMFSIDFDGYPDSSYIDLDFNERYCGAMKLCEAMVGQDGLGFHPDSKFDASDGAKLYFNRNPLANPDNPSLPERQNLQARKSLYTEGEGVQIGSMEALYLNNTVASTGGFDPNCPVLCDVFKRNQLRVRGEKAGMPILYYKADTSKLLHEKVQLTEPYSVEDNIYNYYDNYDLIVLGVPWSGEVHPYETPPFGPPGGLFYDQTTDKNAITMDKPYNRNSYILISAGNDGLYGTEDDIFNFER